MQKSIELKTVYLVIHELFGIISSKSGFQVVTPEVLPQGECPGHTYKICRFKEGLWKPDYVMKKDATYRLEGVLGVQTKGAAIPPHPEFNPHPRGQFPLVNAPFCQWQIALTNAIHQLRLVTIVDRPLFTGQPEGDAVNRELKAVSLLQAFEYIPDPDVPLRIFENGQELAQIDCSPDKFTNTVNIHLWAQLEDESFVTDDDMANAHSIYANGKLVDLFGNLNMKAQKSVWSDGTYSQQLAMPNGIRFVEMMTLGERFSLVSPLERIECIHKTCGIAGNIYVGN